MYSIGIRQLWGLQPDTQETIIWTYKSPEDSTKIEKAELHLCVNSPGSLTLTIPYCNVGYTKIKMATTIVTVYRQNKAGIMEELWRGRPITEDLDFNNNRVIVCEGELGYFNDSTQEPAVFGNSISEYLQAIIDKHNSQQTFDECKFELGFVTVPDDALEYHYTDYESTWECISSKLLNVNGGILRVRHSGDVRYLDYLNDYPPAVSDPTKQEIIYGYNLIDLTKNTDIENIVTVMVPLGASKDIPSIENKVIYTPNHLKLYKDPIPKYYAKTSEIEEVFDDTPILVFGDYRYARPLSFRRESINDNKESDIGHLKYIVNLTNGATENAKFNTLDTVPDCYPEPEEYVTIESVNNNVKYIEDADLIRLYGRIEKIIHFDGVEDPADVLASGLAYFDYIKSKFIKVNIKAVDMHNVSIDVPSIDLLERVKVKSLPHNVELELPVTDMDIRLDNPSESSIELGGTDGMISKGMIDPAPSVRAKEPEFVYGISISSPAYSVNGAAIIRPLENTDSVGMTPAHMNYDTGKFDYGDWENVFFMPKPCILGVDGTVIKYLDPNDYTKDVDGNTVDIGGTLHNANVMIEFPKIYMSVRAVPPYDVESDKHLHNAFSEIRVSNVKMEDDFYDFPYIDHNGVHKDHFYMSAYPMVVVNDSVRSVSGESLVKHQRATYYRGANNIGSGWCMESYGAFQMINALLMIMTLSIEFQNNFGSGRLKTLSQSGCQTGLANDKGLFYGNPPTNLDGVVKIFGMEHWWGLEERYLNGLGAVISPSTESSLWVQYHGLYKLCYGTEDGTTESDYSISPLSKMDNWISAFIDDTFTPSASFSEIHCMTFVDNGIFPSWNVHRNSRDLGYGSMLHLNGNGATSGYCIGAHGGFITYNNLYYVGAFNMALYSTSASAPNLLCGLMYI